MYKRQVQAVAKATPRPVASIPLSPLWIEKRREMLIIEDAATDPRLDEATRARLADAGQAAVVALPLRRGGQWQGLLTLSWPQPYQLTSDEAFILQRLHEPLAATVASRRAYLAQRAALAQTEAALAAQARLSRELRAVSYTHLDVYKRQISGWSAAPIPPTPRSSFPT